MFDGAEAPPPVETDLIRGLRDARNTIARGWVQGSWGLGSHRCMVAAINESAFRTAQGPTATSLLREQMYAGLVQTTDVVPNRLAEWNDARGRTHAEVIAAFDTTIAREVAKLAARAKIRELIHV